MEIVYNFVTDINKASFRIHRMDPIDSPEQPVIGELLILDLSFYLYSKAFQ